MNGSHFKSKFVQVHLCSFQNLNAKKKKNFNPKYLIRNAISNFEFLLFQDTVHLLKRCLNSLPLGPFRKKQDKMSCTMMSVDAQLFTVSSRIFLADSKSCSRSIFANYYAIKGGVRNNENKVIFATKTRRRQFAAFKAVQRAFGERYFLFLFSRCSSSVLSTSSINSDLQFSVFYCVRLSRNPSKSDKKIYHLPDEK